MICRLLNHGFKRRIAALSVVVFSLAAMLGPLMHAYAGESFDAMGPDHRAVHAIDLHEVEHGHSHNDDWPQDQTNPHSHDHNAGDHSHEVPGVALALVDASGIVHGERYIVAAARHVGNASFGIDRPPRR